MENLHFQHASDDPYHLSVGAIVVDDNHNVYCNYFREALEGMPGEYKKIKDVYILVRETPEVGETIGETLHRGVREELGIRGEAVAYIGSREEAFHGDEYSTIKTTIYFLVKATHINLEERDTEDIEGKAEVVALPIDSCIEKMQNQYQRLGIETLNEGNIAVRAKNFLENKHSTSFTFSMTKERGQDLLRTTS